MSSNQIQSKHCYFTAFVCVCFSSRAFCIYCHILPTFLLHFLWNKRNSVSFSLLDLSSNSIPCEDEEEDYREREENEGTYDDIEGVTGLPPPRPDAALAPLRHGGRRDEGEDQEEDEDIYEVVPGMRASH